MTDSLYARFAKIICTLGPASSTPEVLRGMIAAGMDVARLNLSHGTMAQHAEAIAMVRHIAEEAGRPIGIMADLQGPKLRLGALQPGGVALDPGDVLTFDMEPAPGTRGRVPIPFRDFFHLIYEGAHFLVDDGLLEFEVLSVDSASASAAVIHGGTLQDKKGINILNSRTDVSAMTAKDRLDMVFALQQKVDWIALSFVQSPDNVQEAKELIGASLGPNEAPIPVVTKIEKPKALETIDQILELTDALMVARGDLGIETSAEGVPLIQKELIQKCNALGKPVITATQMLDSMIVNPRPTRAEASDVANAVIDGTDGIMLSGETAVGKHPVLTVQTMAAIVTAAEQRFPAAMPDIETYAFDANPIAVSVSKSIVHVVDEVDAHAILCPTASGYTPKILASFRPNVPIIALTSSPRVQRQLCLYRCVHSLDIEDLATSEEVLQRAIDRALAANAIQEGGRVVLTAGTIMGVAGMTNMMTVRTVVRPLLYGRGDGRAHVLGRCLHFNDSVRALDPESLTDCILFVKEYSARCNPITAACAGLITGSTRAEVEAAHPATRQHRLPTIYEAEGDFDDLQVGQMLILDAVSGRLFDYHTFLLHRLRQA